MSERFSGSAMDTRVWYESTVGSLAQAGSRLYDSNLRWYDAGNFPWSAKRQGNGGRPWQTIAPRPCNGRIWTNLDRCLPDGMRYDQGASYSRAVARKLANLFIKNFTQYESGERSCVGFWTQNVRKRTKRGEDQAPNELVLD